MSSIINQNAYLPTSRSFPEDPTDLSMELSKAYIDITNAVNGRTISLFPANHVALTGEGWFYNNQKQQSLRKIYPFTVAGSFPHGINFFNYLNVPRGFGSYVDTTGNNSYGVIYGTNVPISGQVSFYITKNSAPNVLDGNIIILSGAGAPSIKTGTIIIEWLSII